MKRLPLWATMSLLVGLAGVTGAEEPGLSLFARADWARLHLVLGRIEIDNIRSSQTRSAIVGETESNEKLSISADTITPSVRYRQVTPQVMLIVEVINGNRVRIRRDPANSDSPAISFEQMPGRDLVLRVGKAETGEEYLAPSIWHLLLEQPEVCQQHLLPILQWLQPKWRFKQFSSRTEDELLLRAKTNQFTTARLASQLVRRLDSHDFEVRRAALEEMRQLGTAVLPWLRQVDLAELSREQRQRLERLQTDLRTRASDSPARVADWLVEDERTWLAMLGHEERAVRQIAASHLSKRFPRAFDSEPGVDPSKQAIQIAKLKAKYEVR